MSYYTDLDDDLGAELEAYEHMREQEIESRYKKSQFNRKVKNEVSKQLRSLGVTQHNKSQIKVIKKVRGAKVEVSCLCCRSEFEARVADRKRGWAKFCSKSCKAKMQTNNI